MKRPHCLMNISRTKKIACTVSAAALMLGVSSAATVGLHFQCNYTNAPDYTGYPVTLTAFGIAPSGWENLYPTFNGYGNSAWISPGYTNNEVIDTDTSTNGLNPLPNGSINVTWFANVANFDPFAGYGFPPPYYEQPGGSTGALNDGTNPVTGEQQVYATFLRDGINYGPSADSPDNPLMAYYSVDITGLRSLFTNTPFVVELMASADSMNELTNAFITDLSNLVTNSVTYPNTAPVNPQGGAPWLRGIGGGLSIASGVFSNADHIHIASNIPQHGTSANPNGYDNAGTISGFIFTDKPVMTMSPQTIPVAGPGDTIVLNPYAIGVTPLSCQWRVNGRNIPGATNMSYTIPSVNLASGGSYDLVVTNLYGAVTSKVSVVTVDRLAQTPASEIVADSNPANAQHDGVNMGASWEAASSDGTITRTGVMDFTAAETNGISVLDSAAFDGPTGTITFWMQSAGTGTNAGGTGGAIVCRATGTAGSDFLLLQEDGSPGKLDFYAPNNENAFTSVGGVSDNKWHFVAVTFDQSASGEAELYIDGALDSTNANAAAWSWPGGQPLEIGYSPDSTYKPYNGVLDDVRYYSTNLTASQIAAIHTSGAVADTNDLQMQFNFTTAPGAGIVLTWKETSAVLQSAGSLSGPWVDVTGASSPYTIVPSEAQQFFRYRYVTQSLASNPYLM